LDYNVYGMSYLRCNTSDVGLRILITIIAIVFGIIIVQYFVPK